VALDVLSSIEDVQRRYVILAMAGLLAVGVATPVFGSPAADLALKRAKKAKKIAKTARDAADQALSASQQAGQSAQRANDRLDSEMIVSARTNGLVTSDAPVGDPELRDGPSVQVTVPGSGLIEVWSQADVLDDDGGTLALFEDGQPMPGIADEDFCGDDSALLSMQGGGPGDFETFSTPPTVSLLGCTNAGAPAPVLLETSPGQHTYEVGYSECVCGGQAEFQNRVLRIAPRP
jgi:hypothetical protein